MPRKVVLVAKPGAANTGVGRYVHMLQDGLRAADLDAVRVAPALPPLPRSVYASFQRARMDLRTFLLNYPIWITYPSADIYHLTSQNLASLLLFRRPKGRLIVTVHDIIPYIVRRNPRLRAYRGAADALFDRMAMAGLKRADCLIADSHFTKECVVRHLGIAPDRIVVVHLGVDHERFRPCAVPAALGRRYGLPEDRRYLIYVGSEDPRKNVSSLIQALAEVRRRMPGVELIKVGRAHFLQERARLCDLAEQLGVRAAIHFLDDVPEEDLPVLYSFADLCVMPSLYEGFGFPVLEALACGTPVVCAAAASLPEIAGDAALLFRPGPGEATRLADAIVRMLGQRDLYQSMRTRGLAHAATFVWERAVHQTLDVYGDQALSFREMGAGLA